MEEIIDKYLISPLLKTWHRKSTLIFGILLTLFLYFLYIFIIKEKTIENISYESHIFILVTIIIEITVWRLLTVFPKASKKNISIALAISTETDDQYQTIASDYMAKITNIITESNSKKKFQIIKLKQFQINNIHSRNDIISALKKCRANFIIFGKGKIRTITGQQHHILDIVTGIAHSPIPQQVSQWFTTEFNQLYPANIEIPLSDEYKKFSGASEIVGTASKYMIGVAAYIKQDNEFAENIFTELFHVLKPIRGKSPFLTKTFFLTENRLVALKYARCHDYLYKWTSTQDNTLIDIIETLSYEVKKIQKSDYGSALIRSIVQFLKYRNINKAFAELESFRKVKDAAWRYSFAFLYAYEGNLEKANRYYASAFSHNSDPSVPFQSEEFIGIVLLQEPDKYQLNYCLGLINYTIKLDYILALTYFEKFIEQESENSKFNKSVEQAINYIKKCKTNISTSKSSVV